MSKGKMNEEQYAALMQSNGEIKGMLSGLGQRMDYQNGRLAKHDEKIAAMERELQKQENNIGNIEKHENTEGIAKAKNRDRIWSIVEKLIWVVLGFMFTVIGLILSKLEILNLS